MVLRGDLRVARLAARHGKIPDCPGAGTPEDLPRSLAVEGATLKKTGEHPSRSLGFLSRYHDGELTREETAEFDRHADHCAECRSAAAEYEAVLAMYRSAGPDLPDDLLAARNARRIDTEARQRAPVRFLTLQIDLVWASVLAVALVGALALYALLSRRPPSPVTVAENAAPAPPSPTPAAAPQPPGAPEAAGTAPSPERGQRREKTIAPSTTRDRQPAPPADSLFAPEPDRAPTAGGAATNPAPAVPAEAKVGGAAAEMASSDAPRGALPVGGPVSAPILIRRVEPVVSPDARQRIAGGAPVVIVAVISEDGEVTRPRIVRSNPALDGAVLAAVRQWRYRPALKDGKPVAAYLTITVNADLR
jgi:protein TonB